MSGTKTTVVAPPVLGKRKRPESLILQLSGGSESEGDNSDLSTAPIASSSKIKLDRAPIIVNGRVVFDEKRRYRCVVEGCGKSYTKPCRLEEHERTHTGEVRVSTALYKNWITDVLMAAHRGPSFAPPVETVIFANAICKHISGYICQTLLVLTFAHVRDATRSSGRLSISKGMRHCIRERNRSRFANIYVFALTI